jgi:hypothetical protein
LTKERTVTVFSSKPSPTRPRSLAVSLLGAVCGLGLVSACAAHKDANPVPVPLAVQFPSTQAAVYIDTVRIYAFDSSVACADLITLEKGNGTLPTPVVPIPEQSPCTLEQGPTVDLPLGGNFTMFAVGSKAGVDKLIGCTSETSFGEQAALDIPLTFIDNTVAIDPTTCFKLSDFCAGSCQ